MLKFHLHIQLKCIIYIVIFKREISKNREITFLVNRSVAALKIKSLVIKSTYH